MKRAIIIIYFVKIWSILVLNTIGQEYLPPSEGSNDESPGPYEFNYEVKDSEANLNFKQSEMNSGDKTSGSYQVLLPDGRTQLVKYEAEPDGYMAQVTYEGTASSGAGKTSGGYHYYAASDIKPIIKPKTSAKLMRRSKSLLKSIRPIVVENNDY